MQTLSAKAGIPYISARDALCTAEGCLTRIGDNTGTLTFGDTNHLSPEGSQFLMEAIAKRIFPQ